MIIGEYHVTSKRKYKFMKIRINDYLKTFLLDSMVFGLIMAIGEYLDSSEINVWKLIVLSMSGGALSSYSFVTAIRRARKDHEIPLHKGNNDDEKKEIVT